MTLQNNGNNFRVFTTFTTHFLWLLHFSFPVGRNLIPTPEEGVSRTAIDDNFALYMAESTVTQSDLYPCHLEAVGPKYMNVEQSFAFPKGSPLKHILDFHLMKLRETGVLQGILNKWSAGGSKGSCSSNNGLLELGLQEAFGMFIILAFGIAGSVLLLGLESILRAKKRQRLRRSKEKGEDILFGQGQVLLADLDRLIKDIRTGRSSKGDIKMQLEKMKFKLQVGQ